MKLNRFRQRIVAGGVPVGHMIGEFGTRGIAKLLAVADVDFVIFDMEHSGFDLDRIADLLAWSRLEPFSAFVRVPQAQYHFIARVLDAGAGGIMVPNVESAEQARSVVEIAKYPPTGRRGVGLGGAHTDYAIPDPAEYLPAANTSTVVICQIESTAGVENAAKIASVDGVDLLWLGHFDLSASMGIPGRFDDPRIQAAFRTVAKAAAGAGKRAGSQPRSIAQADEWMKLGFSVFSWQSDAAVYRTALTEGIGQLRRLAAGRAAAT